MSQVNPPYRADVVGSFLRPKELLDARHAFQAEKLDRASLTALEDRLIKDLVEKEVKNGLKAVTDGEFRRSFWHLDFLAGLSGLHHVKAEHWSVHFEGFQPCLLYTSPSPRD